MESADCRREKNPNTLKPREEGEGEEKEEKGEERGGGRERIRSGREGLGETEVWPASSSRL